MNQHKKILYLVFILFFIGCRAFPHISENYIKNAVAFDESVIQVNENGKCNHENLIREKFPNYRIHRHSINEIWFFDFKNIIRTTQAGNFYLLEVYIVDYSNPAKTSCYVKYFSSFERRLNKIKDTDESSNGINNLIKILKNCNNER